MLVIALSFRHLCFFYSFFFGLAEDVTQWLKTPLRFVSKVVPAVLSPELAQLTNCSLNPNSHSVTVNSSNDEVNV